jgi:hypothetical protein
MTQDEIIEMARKVGLPHWYQTKEVVNIELLEAFAKLVAQHEREKCIDIVAMFGGSIEIEAAIRARG